MVKAAECRDPWALPDRFGSGKNTRQLCSYRRLDGGGCGNSGNTLRHICGKSVPVRVNRNEHLINDYLGFFIVAV